MFSLLNVTQCACSQPFGPSYAKPIFLYVCTIISLRTQCLLAAEGRHDYVEAVVYLEKNSNVTSIHFYLNMLKWIEMYWTTRG